MDPLSNPDDTSSPLVTPGMEGGSLGVTEELDFEPLSASSAASRLGGAGNGLEGIGGSSILADSSAMMTSVNMGASVAPAPTSTPAPSPSPAAPLQGSLFERIQAAQQAQMGGQAGAPSQQLPFAQQQPATATAAFEEPTMYASAPSVPQYDQQFQQPGPYGGGYGGGGGGGDMAERASGLAGAAWDAALRVGGKAARVGYRALGTQDGNQAGLMSDAEAGMGGMGGGFFGGAPTSAGPTVPPPAAEAPQPMQGIGGGGMPQEQYSMVAYARQIISDISGLVAAAPAPVQYCLIVVGFYLLWKVFG